jgi:transcriptional regulator with XRE-family HTH domain
MKPDTFATRLRELRSRAGLTQAELSRKAGLAQPSVSRLERGLKKPGLATAQALAAALGVSLARLAGPTNGNTEK